MNLLEHLKRTEYVGQFHPNIFVDVENKLVKLYLEDVQCFSEWIRGEGADICLLRADDDARVVGAVLPLNEWHGQFPVSIL